MSILILVAALLGPVDPLSSPSNSQMFGDWTVACDNVRRCEAQALLPESADTDDKEWGRLRVVRAAGPAGRATVTTFVNNGPAAAAIRIDGRTTRLRADSDGNGAVPAAGVTALLPAIAAARRIELLDARGRSAAPVSPDGASAALRFIDDGQQRTGGVTAIVARGPASAVPAAPAIPVFASVRPPRTAPAVVTAAEIARLRRQSGCPVDAGGPGSAPRYRIADGVTLLLLSCGAGAYNANSVPYVITERGGRRSIGYAPFQFLPYDSPDRRQQPSLTNAEYDAETGMLSSFGKARGIGDCGASSAYRWDGTRFRTTEERVMGECRGSTDYLRTWVAQAR